jgi:hypothetical protein
MPRAWPTSSQLPAHAHQAVENADVAGHVLSAEEISSSFSIGDALGMDCILVYGDTLDAYHAMAVLEKNGVRFLHGKKRRW